VTRNNGLQRQFLFLFSTIKPNELESDLVHFGSASALVRPQFLDHLIEIFVSSLSHLQIIDVLRNHIRP